MLSVDLLRSADAKDIISYYRPRPDAAGLIDVPNVIPDGVVIPNKGSMELIEMVRCMTNL